MTRDDEWLTVQETAALLKAAKLSVRKKISSGELPAYRMTNKPGSAIRVKRSDVDKLMKPIRPPVSKPVPDDDRAEAQPSYPPGRVPTLRSKPKGANAPPEPPRLPDDDHAEAV